MKWYVVHTKPYQEDQAAHSLETHGVETFCPRIKQQKMIRRKNQLVTGPLFPGYLFAKFDIASEYRAVIYARGVRSVVTFGATPAVVDEELIASFRSRLDDGCLIVPPRTFQRGQIVRIQAGPLHGLEAVFERELDDQERAVLLLQTLAYQARVTVPLRQVVNGECFSAKSDI